MPHAQCSTCKHPDLAVIDAALSVGTRSIRELARQFGLTKDAIFRHKKHLVGNESAQNASVEDIEEEISKLRRAQKQAKKRRDTASALRISAELRQWMTLRSKAEAIAAVTERRDTQEISHSEALALSMALVEGELASGSPELFSWLQSLIERFPATFSTTPGAIHPISPEIFDEMALDHPVVTQIPTPGRDSEEDKS